jgi:hypothetical protein
MYLQAQRFGEVNGLFTDIGPRQAKSYLLAINALSLVDKKHAWLAAPVSSKRHRSDQVRLVFLPSSPLDLTKADALYSSFNV